MKTKSVPEKYKHLIGQTFSRIKVLSYIGLKGHSHIFECLCECGNKCVKYRTNLNANRSNSCGCLRKENAKHIRTNQLDVGEGAKRVLYRDYKRNAVNRNIDFNLNLFTFSKITKENCFYCGIEPSRSVLKGKSKRNQYNGDYIYNGIDRKNNNLGYTIQNSVACCTICNYMKKELSYKEFVSHIEKILEHLK